MHLEHNGAMLPVVFRSVLYLDVFGWSSQATAGHGHSCCCQHVELNSQKLFSRGFDLAFYAKFQQGSCLNHGGQVKGLGHNI